MQLSGQLRVSGQLFIIALPGTLVLGAWGVLLALQQQPAPLGSHPEHGVGHILAGEPFQALSLPTIAAFALSWTLMILAMMVPGTLPFIAHFTAVAQQEWPRWSGWPSHLLRVALFVVGYSGVWLLFGLVADLGYWGAQALQQFLARLAGTATEPGAVLPATLLLAGLYQFTPAKQRALGESCASDRLLADAGQTCAPISRGMRLGLQYGWRCLGSCWALMLLMIAGGSGSHYAGPMLVLGAIMALEKNTEWAASLSRSLGGFLIGIAIMVVWAEMLGLALVPMPAHS